MALRLIAMLLSTALAVSIGEAGLRVCACARIGLGFPRTAGVQPFPDNPAGVFRFRYNSLGDRTREPAPDATLDGRWCVVGDSHASGLGVDDADRLSEVLERSLTRAGKRVDVFNVAAPGTTLPDYVAMIERCQRVYAARTVVAVLYLGNDLIELARWIDEGRPDGRLDNGTDDWTERVKRVLRYSYTFDGAAFALRAVRMRNHSPESNDENDGLQAYSQARFYVAHPAREETDAAVFVAQLQEMKRVSAGGHTRLIVVALPSWLQVDPGASRDPLSNTEIAIERRLADRIRSEDIEHMDAIDSLKTFPGQAKFWRVDRHLSTLGHALLGEAVFRYASLTSSSRRS